MVNIVLCLLRAKTFALGMQKIVGNFAIEIHVGLMATHQLHPISNEVLVRMGAVASPILQQNVIEFSPHSMQSM